MQDSTTTMRTLLTVLLLGTAHGFSSVPSTSRMEGKFTLEDGSPLPYEAQVPIRKVIAGCEFLCGACESRVVVIPFYLYQVPHVAGGAPLLFYISPTCRPLSFWKTFVAGGAAHAVALGWAFAMVELPQYHLLPGEPTPGWFCSLNSSDASRSNDTSWANQSAACIGVEGLANQLFSGEASPLAVLCRSPTIDCSKGVGIVGTSLPGSIAKQAARMDARVTATLITSVPQDPCTPSVLPPSKVLALIGADEEFYVGVTGLQALTGAPQSACGTSTRCIAADGSGYNVIQSVEPVLGVSSSVPNHLSFLLRFWLGEDEEWHYPAALEWLMGAARA